VDLFARAACGFAIALCCTPAGVSGAFLLLPVQVQVFNAASPTASATNLVYNLIATPAGARTFQQRGGVDPRLAQLLLAGTTPGVMIGVLLRATWLSSEGAFAWVASLLLVALGVRLVVARAEPDDGSRSPRHVRSSRLATVGAVGGAIGGIYGFGGAALIVPWLVSVERLSVRQVAGAGMVTTLVTSAVGLVSFAVAAAAGLGDARPPEWTAGLAFGLGGGVGAVLGARLQPCLPAHALRVTLGLVAIAAGVRMAV
jgi:uncharacterized membrane protein YfcA